MYRIEVPKIIQRFTELLYQLGFWHRHGKGTAVKIFYSIYFSLFPISIAAGAFLSDVKDEKIISILTMLIAAVDELKLLYLIWKKEEILELFDRICDYGSADCETYTTLNEKLTTFKKVAGFFLGATNLTIFAILFVAPFLSSERKFVIRIGFPLDWQNSELAYWTAFMFMVTEGIIATILIAFYVLVWYLMANCSWRYEALGLKIKRIGTVAAHEQEILNIDRDNLYNQHIIGAITSYNSLKQLTEQLVSFMSNLFMVQLTTGALCICMSIYTMTLVRADNLVELLIYLGFSMYSFFDIFMIMYFGNEIKLASGRLLYNLFESNWIDRSQSVTKKVLIFGEFLMQPQQLMILKIHPLTLETFKRILNSSYSLFNILKNFK